MDFLQIIAIVAAVAGAGLLTLAVIWFFGILESMPGVGVVIRGLEP